MSRDRIAGIGFQHPNRNARPLTKRKIALAHLLMTAVLVICILVAVTAVTVGMARADTLNVLAQGHDGSFALILLIGLVLAATGALSAVAAYRPPADRG